MNSKIKNKILIRIVFLCAVIAAFVFAQKTQPRHRYRESQALFGTTASIDVCLETYDPDENTQKAYARVWERLADIHSRMSIFNDASDVSNINRSYQNPVKVQKDTFEVIRKAFEFTRLTSGAFDITVLPLIQLWKKSAQKNVYPSLYEITEIQKGMGEKNIRFLPDDRIEVLTPNTKIDLGGIAVGLAIDDIVRIFADYGINDYFIDLGGDIFASGSNCSGKTWRVGIKDPMDSKRLIGTVGLRNQGITTSGDYEQHYLIQGKQYSHIMNPVTGLPVNTLVSATVIAPTGIEADVLATALCVLNPQKGIELIDSMGENYAALAVEKNKNGETVFYPSKYFAPE